MPNFGATPTSTTVLSSNQFPVSAGFVPNTASGNLTSIQLGPASTDSNSYVSAPIATYTPDGNDIALGTSTDAAGANSVIGQLKQIRLNTASVTIGSGTVAATQSGPWTITANIGTTGGVALDTSVNGILLAQGSATSGQKGSLIQGAVTTSAPTYTTGQTSPISLTPAGALRVDASATVQPVSGTFWQATQPISAASLPLPTGAATSAKQPAPGTAGSASSDVLTVQGIASMTPLKTDGSGVTQPISGTVTVQQATGTNLHTVVDSGAITATTNADTTIGGTTAPSKGLLTIGKTNDGTPQYQPLPEGTGGRSVIIEGYASGTAVPVSGTFWQATQPVSGTVTANIGTTNGLALDATIGKLNVSQGTALGSNTGPMFQGSATTNAPSYTTGTINPLSLDTSGLLRASLKDTPSNTNNLNVNLAASTATVSVSGTVTANAGTGNFTVTQGTGSNLHAVLDSGSTTAVTQATASNLNAQVVGAAASGASNTGNPVKVGGAFNTTQPTVTNGQAVDAQYTARGAQIVATGVDAFAVNASQAGTWNITNVSGAVSLPTGAATSAKQPALGTAGSASTDVLTVQGIASMTALKVDGSGVTQPVSGTVTANQGSANATPWNDNIAQFGGTGVSLGSKTSASSMPVVIASDQGALSIQHGNVVDAGNSSSSTLTANSVFTGTGTSALNYSALAIEVFADQASAANGLSIQQSQDNSHWDLADTFSVSASTVFTTSVNLVGQYYRIVYTNGGTNQGAFRLQTIKMVADAVLPRTLTAAGNLRVDGSGVTQPVSGTVSANQSGAWTVQPGNTANTTPWLATINQGGNSATVTGSNALKVDGSGVTQPVSGTITANIGTSGSLALDTSVNGILLSQGSTTSGEKGPLIQAAVTTGAPSYTTAQTSPLSLTTAGALRTDASATTQPVSGTVTANAGSGTFTIQSNASVNVNQVAGSSVATAATGIMKVGLTDGSGNAISSTAGALNVSIASGGGSGFSATDEAAWTAGTTAFVPAGGVYNDSAAALTSGQEGTARSTPNRALHINVRNNSGTELATASNPLRIDPTGTTTQPISGTVTANQGGSNWSVNVAQVAGNTTATAATGVQKVGIVGNSGATVDSTIAAGTAPTNAIVSGTVYNASAPAPTSGQAMALQSDQAGNTRVFPGAASTALSAWSSATSLNATQTIFTNSGAQSVLVQLTQTTTLTGGAITFEVSYEGLTWNTAPADCVLDPTSATYVQISIPYTVQANTSKAFLLNMNGAQALRIKLSTVISGTGTVTPNYTLLPFSPADTVIALSPTAANFNVTVGGSLPTGSNTIGSTTIQAVSGTALAADQTNSILKTSLYVKKTAAADTVLALGSATSANSVPVVVASDQGAIPASQSGTWNITNISGTVSLPTGAAQDSSVNGLLVSQGSTTSGEKGPMVQGAVTTNAPSYTTAQTSPVSLDTSGLLRVSIKDTPSNTNNFNVNLAASAATVTVSGTVTSNQGGSNWSQNVAQIGGTNVVTGGASGLLAVGGPVASGASNADNPVKVGGAYNSTQPTVTTGQIVDAQMTARGAQIVATGVDTFNATINAALPAGSNTIGAVTQASGPWTSNITQFGGNNVATGTGASGSGIPRVTVANDSNVLATQSGTWTVQQGGSPWGQNLTQVGGSSIALGQTTMSASVPVAIASNQGAVPASQSGTWTIQPGNTANTTPWLVQTQAGTAGGSTPYHLLSAASNNATSLKSSAGLLYGYSISNTNASVRWVKFYNKASAPAPATDAVVWAEQVPGNATILATFPEGMTFGTGIAFAAVVNASDTDNTSIGAGDLSIDIRYK